MRQQVASMNQSKRREEATTPEATPKQAVAPAAVSPEAIEEGLKTLKVS